MFKPGARKVAVCVGALLLIVVTATIVLGHDLFLRPDDYFLAPNASVRVRVLNGTFEQSEGAVAFDRVTDLTLAGPAGVTKPGDHDWRSNGDTSMFTLRVGGAGTYLVGVSTRPRIIELTAADFNAYLESDGIPDMLVARRQNGDLDKPAREQYSKHVKALVQVGDARTGGLDRPFGYPAEVIPLQNPYTLRHGATLSVRALVGGRPIRNQLILAGGRMPSGARHPVQRVRTDTGGVARIRLATGTWYVKFIHMVTAPTDSTNYESKWASLTFAVQ